jgi:ABC-type transport system involved in cytochrome c biogenesis permease subunit
MKWTFRILAALTLILLSLALYLALGHQALVINGHAVLTPAPTERTMGDVQRIFYYHVPSAWTAFCLFLTNYFCSLLTLTYSEAIRRAANRVAILGAIFGLIGLLVSEARPSWLPQEISWVLASVTVIVLALFHALLIKGYFLLGQRLGALFSARARVILDAVAVSSAEVGVIFCTIVLVTGPIWARPVWGIWWTWDVRLTTTLALWLIYVSYLVLRRFSNTGEIAILSASLAVIGALDVPFVYFSIWFFRTQHPRPVMGGGGSLDPRMLHAFLINLLAFSCFGAMVCWWRVRLELLHRKVEEAHAMASLAGGVPARPSRPLDRSSR